MTGGFVAFAVMNIIGVARIVLENPAFMAESNPLQTIVTNNEFVSPIQTLMYYTLHPYDLRWGLTYLAAPTLFIPRAIWIDKPESLSLQFMRDAFGTTALMGYAYTPVTEAYLNFGAVGPFLMYAILSVLMVKLVRNVDRHVGLYFISFALVVDFNRGDTAGTLYQLVVVGAAYSLMLYASRLRWVPGGTKDVFSGTAPTSATGGMARDY